MRGPYLEARQARALSFLESILEQGEEIIIAYDNDGFLVSLPGEWHARGATLLSAIEALSSIPGEIPGHEGGKHAN